LIDRLKAAEVQDKSRLVTLDHVQKQKVTSTSAN
jgi:hypothetical protein